MKELILIVEILFKAKAKESFNFPIKNSIRLSFWLSNAETSTFSEIQIQNKTIDIGKPEIVKIKLVEREFLVNRIKADVEFEMGTFPVAIASGKIIKVEKGKN